MLDCPTKAGSGGRVKSDGTNPGSNWYAVASRYPRVGMSPSAAPWTSAQISPSGLTSMVPPSENKEPTARPSKVGSLKNAFPNTKRSTPKGFWGSSATGWSKARTNSPPIPTATSSSGQKAGESGVTHPGKFRHAPESRVGAPKAVSGVRYSGFAPRPGS